MTRPATPGSPALFLRVAARMDVGARRPCPNASALVSTAMRPKYFVAAFDHRHCRPARCRSPLFCRHTRNIKNVLRRITVYGVVSVYVGSCAEISAVQCGDFNGPVVVQKEESDTDISIVILGALEINRQIPISGSQHELAYSHAFGFSLFVVRLLPSGRMHGFPFRTESRQEQ